MMTMIMMIMMSMTEIENHIQENHIEDTGAADAVNVLVDLVGKIVVLSPFERNIYQVRQSHQIRSATYDDVRNVVHIQPAVHNASTEGNKGQNSE